MPAMMPMIAMTISSSMSVNPFSFFISPVVVMGLSVERRPVRRRVHVVDVLVSPGIGVRLVLIGPQPPFLVLGHRVDRNTAQELDLLPEGARLLHAVHQGLQVGR